MPGLRENRAPRMVVANWKMSLSIGGSAALAAQIAKLDARASSCAIGVAPSYTAIATCATALKDTVISLGAQNVCQFESGAYTGEISALTLSELGCSFALIGHSERRHIYAETIELCAARAKMALAAELEIIFCVGETLAQRQANQTSAVLEAQLAPLLELLKLDHQRNRVTIAYEPVWAIGTGVVAKTQQIADAHELIAKFCGNDLPILYGGSVTPENFAAILDIPNVSGGLIGGASLDAAKFSALVETAIA